MKKQLNDVIFIINPISGPIKRPDRLIFLINDTWKNCGIKYSIKKSDHRGHAIELAKEAVEKKVDMVVAVGGDGTINEIGRGLVGSDTALGVIPTGSGNGFARNFGIPLKINSAIKSLINPFFRKIDVGKMNGHHFLNVAGIGLDAEISAHFDRFGFRGPLSYFIVGVRQFIKYKPESMTLVLNNNHKIVCQPMLLSIANAPQFGNGAIIAPGAIPDDGLLDICILSMVSSIKAISNIKKLFDGTIDQVDEMKIYQSPRVLINRKKEGYIHTDGDPHLELPDIDIEVLSKSLTVAVPQNDGTIKN
jgi:YegS/Rv2252/BmrU family lipid kinase